MALQTTRSTHTTHTYTQTYTCNTHMHIHTCTHLRSHAVCAHVGEKFFNCLTGNIRWHPLSVSTNCAKPEQQCNQISSRVRTSCTNTLSSTDKHIPTSTTSLEASCCQEKFASFSEPVGGSLGPAACRSHILASWT